MAELERDEIAGVRVAFEDTVAVLRQSLKLFVRLAIWVPIILALIGIILSAVVVKVISNSSRMDSAEIEYRLRSIHDVAKDIRQTQTIHLNVEAQRTEADNIHDILKNRGEVK